MKEMEIINDDELESQTLSHPKKYDRKPTGDDPVSDYLLKMYYMINQSGMMGVKIGICCVPFVVIFLFTLFVSNSTSNVIAFTALIISFCFMVLSIWILCEILDKDRGSREMQDISDPIKEGSEGFFIT
jgi:hypothetical protein